MRKIKNPQIGEYVLLTNFADKSIYDPWFIGFFEKKELAKNGITYFYCTGHVRGFRNCYRISKDEGHERFEQWRATGIP